MYFRILYSFSIKLDIINLVTYNFINFLNYYFIFVYVKVMVSNKF